MDEIENRPDEGGDQAERNLYDQERSGDVEATAVVEGDEVGDVDALDDGVEEADIEALDDLARDDLALDDLALDSVPSWVGVVSGAGLGLAIVQALVLLGTVAQGIAIDRFDGDFFHKIGVALLSNVGSANGLALLVAAVLAAFPALLGIRSTEAQRQRGALTFGLVGVLAVLLIVGTPLAVRARVRVIDLGGQSVDALAQRVLATYVAGTLGTALVALAAALGLSRLTRRGR